MKNTIKGELVIEYMNRFPKHSKKSIAKILVKDHPILFKTIEEARGSIRYHTGTSGKKNLYGEKIKHESECTRENQFGIPKSYSEDREPFILPVIENNILIISDLHIPYHDISSIQCAVKYGKENRINTIFINGDLLDFHQLSRFEKDPRKRNTKEEIEAGIEFLNYLRQEFPRAKIYYHYGNHDIRYERWIMSHPEIFGDPYYELESRMGLLNLGVRMVDDRTITKAGHLMIHHGHYIFKGTQSPVSPGKTIIDKAGHSMICGHVHKVSEYTKLDVNGDIYTGWSSGCLSELLPDYSPMCNNYAHGFAHAIIAPDKTFTLRNYRIKNGKIL